MALLNIDWSKITLDFSVASSTPTWGPSTLGPWAMPALPPPPPPPPPPVLTIDLDSWLTHTSKASLPASVRLDSVFVNVTLVEGTGEIAAQVINGSAYTVDVVVWGRHILVPPTSTQAFLYKPTWPPQPAKKKTRRGKRHRMRVAA